MAADSNSGMMKDVPAKGKPKQAVNEIASSATPGAADTNSMAAVAGPPVTIQRMPDGRHAVMSPEGAVLGMHNSPFSAARQVHEYFGPVPGAAPATTEAAPAHLGTKRNSVHAPTDPSPGMRAPGKQSAKVPRP